LLLSPPEAKLEAENSFKTLTTQLTVKWLSNPPPPHTTTPSPDHPLTPPTPHHTIPSPQHPLTPPPPEPYTHLKKY